MRACTENHLPLGLAYTDILYYLGIVYMSSSTTPPTCTCSLYPIKIKVEEKGVCGFHIFVILFSEDYRD